MSSYFILATIPITFPSKWKWKSQFPHPMTKLVGKVVAVELLDDSSVAVAIYRDRVL